MLSWLSDFLNSVTSILPRFSLVRSTHKGVLFYLGKARAVNPGMIFYWPLISELVTICVVRQTINLPWQALETKDSHAICIAVTIVYEIDDIYAALTGTDNIVDTIQDLSHRAIKRVASESTLAELGDSSKIDSLLKKRLTVDLRQFGVNVRRAFVSEFSRPIMVRMMGDIAAN